MAPKMDKKKMQEKEKIAVDKTFGMKNKNKSKVVQKYIKSITANATGAPKGGREEQARLDKDAKQKDVAKNALMNSLFNIATDKKGRGYDAVAKKKAKQSEEEAKAAGKKLNDETRKEIIEGIANSIRLTNPKGVRMSALGGHVIIHALKEKYAETFVYLSLLLFIKANEETFWVDDPESSNPTVRCQADVDAEVAPDERSIEEIIEEKRAALPPGGTPVTLESFKAWKISRELMDEARKEEEAAERKKKAKAKNFAGLSGRDLFTFNADMFNVDDDGAASANEYDERSEHTEDSSDDEPTKKAPKDEVEDDEDDEEDEEEGNANDNPGGAKGSDKPVAINENLFLEGGDLPDDDLDDLDSD